MGAEGVPGIGRLLTVTYALPCRLQQAHCSIIFITAQHRHCSGVGAGVQAPPVIFVERESYLACKVSLTPLNYKRVLSDYMNILTVQMSLRGSSRAAGYRHRQSGPRALR